MRRLGPVTCAVAAASCLLVAVSGASARVAAHDSAAAALTSRFVQQGPKLAANDAVKSAILGTAAGQFGFSVALSADGGTGLVGGPNDNGGRGAAWIFTRTGKTWKQDGKKLLPKGDVGEALFGQTVAISDDGRTVLVGGTKFAGALGAAWVFVRSGSGWKQQTRFLSVASTGGVNLSHAFGSSVALSGDGNVALVGASLYNDRIGASFLFRRTGSNWTRIGKTLSGAGGVNHPGYGSSVALSADGKTATVGGPYDGQAEALLGAVWTYRISASGWTPVGGPIVAKGALTNGSFGQSLALSANGDTLLVGSNKGGAWLFKRSGSTWKQAAKLTAPIPDAAMFGYSVALSAAGTTAIVGAPYFNNGAGSSWAFTGSGSKWSPAARLATGGAAGLATIGWGVGVAGDGKTAFVGGPSDADGVGAAWAESRA